MIVENHYTGEGVIVFVFIFGKHPGGMFFWARLSALSARVHISVAHYVNCAVQHVAVQ